MPRDFNRKCAKCAFMPIAESRERSCWIEGKCNNTRKYYRSRDRQLETKKKQYASFTGKTLPTTFEIIPDTYRAELILFGKSPDKQKLVKGGVRGFQVLIYRGSHLSSKSEIVSCGGMNQANLESAIDKALTQVGELFQIKTWGKIIWQDVEL